MGNFAEYIKKHKLLVGGGVLAAIILWLVLRSSSSGSSSPADHTLALAQLQAAANQQNAQISGQVEAANLSASSQQNQAQIAANVQEEQVQAELQAQQDTTAANLTADIFNKGSDNAIYQAEIDAANQEYLANEQLQATLAPTALATAKLGGRANSQTGEAELATIFGQGSTATSTLNSSLGAASIASTIENTKLLQGLEGVGGSVLGGL